MSFIMIHMKKSILIFYIPILLSGCAVLSNSQLQNINTFATATKNYTGFPGEVVKQGQQLQYNNNILEASVLPDSGLIIQSLTKSKEQYKKGLDFSKKMDLSLRLIQDYTALLVKLTSDSYTNDLGENTTELCGSLNNAVALFNSGFSTQIPPNVGEGISSIINIVGNRIIKNKQAKALKKFIPIADTLIQVTKDKLVEALDDDLKNLIENYKATFQTEYHTIVFNHIEKVDYNMLHFYVQTNTDYENIELLRQKCKDAAVKMALAHKELKNNITGKKKLMELLHETKDFVTDVKGLYAYIKNPSPATE